MGRIKPKTRVGGNVARGGRLSRRSPGRPRHELASDTCRDYGASALTSPFNSSSTVRWCRATGPRGALGGAMATSVKSAETLPARPARGRPRRVVLTPPSDRERAFAAASRRSRGSGFLRKAILVGALGTVAAMILIAVFNPFATKVGSLSFSEPFGRRNQNHNGEAKARRVSQRRAALCSDRGKGAAGRQAADRGGTAEAHLGKSGWPGERRCGSSADSGVYDSVAESMRLSSNVRIGNARFEVRLRSAAIDFKTGVYRSDEPVEVHVGEGTTIVGDRATARDNGRELIFEGHVRTRIVPQPDAADADAKRANP